MLKSEVDEKKSEASTDLPMVSPGVQKKNKKRDAIARAKALAESRVIPDAELMSLSSLHKNMLKVNTVQQTSIADIEQFNTGFRERINNFKKNYGSMAIYDSTIKELENSILQGQQRNRTLELFNEASNFAEPLATKSLAELNIITNITIMPSDSSSNSYIFTADYEGKPCYIKSFFNSQRGLLYEQQIYNYINKRNVLIKPFFEDYFVKVYDTLKLKCSVFKELLANNRATMNNAGNRIPQLLDYKLVSEPDIFLIITEDIGGITYEQFFIENYENRDLITNTLFDIVYGIYLMNSRLNIMHNDNHFGNILIKRDLPETECKYQINKIEYTKKKNYRLCFYDFDLAYLAGMNNPNAVGSWIVQNKKSAKDIWTLLNSIIRLIHYNLPQRKKEYLLNQIFGKQILSPAYWSIESNNRGYGSLLFIVEIVDIIIDNSPLHREQLEKIYFDFINKGLFWNSYCIDNIQDICTIPDDKDLYSLQVLQRFLSNDNFNKIYRIIGFTKVDPFYKKYLKYKSKYLELKKKEFN